MNDALQHYIDTARSKGRSDERITRDLVDAGWDAAMVKTALAGDDSLVPPPPPAPAHAPSSKTTDQSDDKAGDRLVKIVPYRSTAGLEYLILFISLWITASAFAAVLHSLVDGLVGNTDSVYATIASFSTAALIVGLPIFAYLFLRLKKAELKTPEIRRDINRKNAVQLTLLVTFVIGVGKTIFYIYQLLNAGTPDYGTTVAHSLIGNFLHTVITVGVAGAIFVYYWIDDHRKA